MQGYRIQEMWPEQDGRGNKQPLHHTSLHFVCGTTLHFPFTLFYIKYFIFFLSLSLFLVFDSFYPFSNISFSRYTRYFCVYKCNGRFSQGKCLVREYVQGLVILFRRYGALWWGMPRGYVEMMFLLWPKCLGAFIIFPLEVNVPMQVPTIRSYL